MKIYVISNNYDTSVILTTTLSWCNPVWKIGQMFYYRASIMIKHHVSEITFISDPWVCIGEATCKSLNISTNSSRIHHSDYQGQNVADFGNDNVWKLLDWIFESNHAIIPCSWCWNVLIIFILYIGVRVIVIWIAATAAAAFICFNRI